MHLHPDWKLIVKRAWSFRFFVLAGIGAFAEGFVQAYTSGFLAAVPSLAIGAVSAAGGVARIVWQENLPHG
jgi:hypothetical protein